MNRVILLSIAIGNVFASNAENSVSELVKQLESEKIKLEKMETELQSQHPEITMYRKCSRVFNVFYEFQNSYYEALEHDSGEMVYSWYSSFLKDNAELYEFPDKEIFSELHKVAIILENHSDSFNNSFKNRANKLIFELWLSDPDKTEKQENEIIELLKLKCSLDSVKAIYKRDYSLISDDPAEIAEALVNTLEKQRETILIQEKHLLSDYCQIFTGSSWSYYKIRQTVKFKQDLYRNAINIFTPKEMKYTQDRIVYLSNKISSSSSPDASDRKNNHTLQ